MEGNVQHRRTEEVLLQPGHGRDSMGEAPVSTRLGAEADLQQLRGLPSRNRMRRLRRVLLHKVL